MKKILIVLCVMVLASCSAKRLDIVTPNVITNEKIDMIDEGVTTKGQVIATFGEPLDRLLLGGSETYFYKDFNLRAIWIEFDTEGIVTGYKTK